MKTENQLMKVLKPNKDIKDIFYYLVELLTDMGMYTRTLDLPIYNTSVVLYQYNKLAKEVTKQPLYITNDVRSNAFERGDKKATHLNPINKDLIQTAETLRKALKSLGISPDSVINNDIVGGNTNDGLSDMIDKLNSL